MFDFDATLPLMAVQFLLLTFVLNLVFYKPLTKALDERANYIRTNTTEARERLAKAEQLAKEYDRQIAEARRKVQEIIGEAQAEAQATVAAQVQEAQQQVQAERQKAATEIETQKTQAWQALEGQVDVLSGQILNKLLGV